MKLWKHPPLASPAHGPGTADTGGRSRTTESIMPSHRYWSRVLWFVAIALFQSLGTCLALQAAISGMISGGALSAGSTAAVISNGLAPFKTRGGACCMCAARANDLDGHRDFVDRVLSITGDPLEEEGGRVVVFRGNPSARLMMIGEAPGQEEDAQGLPFVGRSGKLLDNVLAAVGLDPERDVYISNIVRRRPLNNRTPTAEELEFYVPLLLEEIRLVDPDVIVTLGASSTKALLPHETRGITKMRGTWVPNDDLLQSHGGALDGRRVMPWFHPSYLIRNAGERSIQEGGVRWLTREDLREVKRTLDVLGA